MTADTSIGPPITLITRCPENVASSQVVYSEGLAFNIKIPRQRNLVIFLDPFTSGHKMATPIQFLHKWRIVPSYPTNVRIIVSSRERVNINAVSTFQVLCLCSLFVYFAKRFTALFRRQKLTINNGKCKFGELMAHLTRSYNRVSLKYGIRTTESPTLKYGKRVYRPDTWRQINSVL